MELTDEQIEKALNCCQWALKNCKDCPLDPNTPCFTNLHLATLKYIERLKGIEGGKKEPKKSKQEAWWLRSNGTGCEVLDGDMLKYATPDYLNVGGILNNYANDEKPLQPLLKIGDSIYRWLDGSYDEWTISEIRIHIGKPQGALNFTLIATSENCGTEYFDSADEGVTWFLTKEQAEERVKQLQEEL